MNSPVLKSFVSLLSFELWIVCICIFRVSQSKFLRAGGLAKLSVLTQLTGCGFVEVSRLVFFSAAYMCPCASAPGPLCGVVTVRSSRGTRFSVCSHLLFPLEVQTFLVCSFVAVLLLKHSHEFPI